MCMLERHFVGTRTCRRLHVVSSRGLVLLDIVLRYVIGQIMWRNIVKDSFFVEIYAEWG